MCRWAFGCFFLEWFSGLDSSPNTIMKNVWKQSRGSVLWPILWKWVVGQFFCVEYVIHVVHRMHVALVKHVMHMMHMCSMIFYRIRWSIMFFARRFEIMMVTYLESKSITKKQKHAQVVNIVELYICKTQQKWLMANCTVFRRDLRFCVAGTPVSWISPDGEISYHISVSRVAVVVVAVAAKLNKLW